MKLHFRTNGVESYSQGVTPLLIPGSASGSAVVNGGNESLPTMQTVMSPSDLQSTQSHGSVLLGGPATLPRREGTGRTICTRGYAVFYIVTVILVVALPFAVPVAFTHAIRAVDRFNTTIRRGFQMSIPHEAAGPGSSMGDPPNAPSTYAGRPGDIHEATAPPILEVETAPSPPVHAPDALMDATSLPTGDNLGKSAHGASDTNGLSPEDPSKSMVTSTPTNIGASFPAVDQNTSTERQLTTHPEDLSSGGSSSPSSTASPETIQNPPVSVLQNDSETRTSDAGDGGSLSSAVDASSQSLRERGETTALQPPPGSYSQMSGDGMPVGSAATAATAQATHPIVESVPVSTKETDNNIEGAVSLTRAPEFHTDHSSGATGPSDHLEQNSSTSLLPASREYVNPDGREAVEDLWIPHLEVRDGNLQMGRTFEKRLNADVAPILANHIHELWGDTSESCEDPIVEFDLDSSPVLEAELIIVTSCGAGSTCTIRPKLSNFSKTEVSLGEVGSQAHYVRTFDQNNVEQHKWGPLEGALKMSLTNATTIVIKRTCANPISNGQRLMTIADIRNALQQYSHSMGSLGNPSAAHLASNAAHGALKYHAHPYHHILGAPSSTSRGSPRKYARALRHVLAGRRSQEDTISRSHV